MTLDEGTHKIKISYIQSAIHRLPPELLVEIFALCSSLSPIFDTEEDDSETPLATEMSRIAHKHLLVVSRVCSRWHGIAMDTPGLWTTVEVDDALWATPASTETAMTLLRAALDRGRNTPLDVVIAITPAVPQFAFDLLVAHAERFRNVEFWCDSCGLQQLSAIRGRLPRLQKLVVWGDSPSNVTMFADAPRLKNVSFEGLVEEDFAVLNALPLQQLRHLQCHESLGVEDTMELGVCSAPSVMHLLSNTTHFSLTLSVSEPDLRDFHDFTSPPITSCISGFSLHITDGFLPHNVGPVVKKVLDSLTLPSLKELQMVSQTSPTLLLPWPHAEFLALCQRSCFRTHLQSLQLQYSIVPADALLECLAELPFLEELAIADHDKYLGCDHHLLTDAVLTHLTATPGSVCPLPRLRAFDCESLLRFDDTALLAFVLSRIRANHAPFSCEIYWLPGHYRGLNPGVLARINQARFQKELAFVFQLLETQEV